MFRSAVESFEHFVGGCPGVEAVLGDLELQLVPPLAGGQFAGALLEATGDDLAQLFAHTELTTASEFS